MSIKIENVLAAFFSDVYTYDEKYNRYIVNQGYCFVMGDNRNVSKDSRLIGTVEKNDIIGKTNFVIFPFNKFGTVEG